MMKKGLVVLLYGVVIAAVIIFKESLLSWLSLGGVERLPWMIGAAILLAMIPLVPFGIVAGIIGAAYGPVWGSLINVVSSTTAAALTFWAVRLIFQERGRQLMASVKGAERFIFLLERNAFFAVILARLLPFVPAVIVNIGAALFRMSFGSFIMATVVGKVPVMVVFAFMGSQLDSNWPVMLRTLFIYMFFLVVVYAGYRVWLRWMESLYKKEPTDEYYRGKGD